MSDFLQSTEHASASENMMVLEAPSEQPKSKKPRNFLGKVTGFLSWIFRWFVGAALCMNFFTSVIVVGWLYRWMQSATLKYWWKQSENKQSQTFREYCESLGGPHAVAKPRWFIRERVGEVLGKSWRGKPPSLWRKFCRLITIPWYSLWLNLRTGFLGLLCIYLVTGWGCLLMAFGWEYGWVISFHKVYEISFVGRTLASLGLLVFALTLIYVPMAMAHQAFTGDGRAFFDVRFVFRLINARLTSYFGLIALMALFAIPAEIVQVVPFAPDFYGNRPELSDQEVLNYFRTYLFFCCVGLFPMLMLLRYISARIYASAVLKALRQGTIVHGELHPAISRSLSDLKIMPVPVAGRTGLLRKMSVAGRRFYFSGLYTGIMIILVLMVFLMFVREFFTYHPVIGFMNHVLVQFPALDLIPGHLQQAVQN